jgi:hypothetical protein
MVLEKRVEIRKFKYEKEDIQEAMVKIDECGVEDTKVHNNIKEVFNI